MATPVSSLFSHNFVGNQGTYNSLLKESVDTTLYSPYGNQSVSGFFREIGGEHIVHNLEYSHFEETRSNHRILATGSVGSAADTTTTQTIESDGQYSFGSYSPFTATGDTDTMLPREGTILQYKNGVKARVMSVNTSAGTFTVHPLKAADTIPAVASGDSIIDLGIFREEGGASPDPYAIRTVEYQNSLVMMSERMDVTDLAMLESTRIQDPETGKWTLKGQNWRQMTERFDNLVDAQCLMGEQVTSATVLSAIPKASYTTGYIPYIESNGTTIDYAQSGLTLADIDEWVLAAQAIGAPEEYIAWGGGKFCLDFADLLKDSAGYASFATFKGNKQIAVNLNCTSFSRGGRTIHLKEMPLFTHPEMFGGSDLHYQYTALMTPSIGLAKDGRGHNHTHLRVNVIGEENGSYNGGYEEKVRGGIMGMTELDENKIEYQVTARKGLEAFGQKRHMMFEATS